MLDEKDRAAVGDDVRAARRSAMGKCFERFPGVPVPVFYVARCQRKESIL